MKKNSKLIKSLENEQKRIEKVIDSLKKTYYVALDKIDQLESDIEANKSTKAKLEEEIRIEQERYNSSKILEQGSPDHGPSKKKSESENILKMLEQSILKKENEVLRLTKENENITNKVREYRDKYAELDEKIDNISNGMGDEESLYVEWSASNKQKTAASLLSKWASKLISAVASNVVKKEEKKEAAAEKKPYIEKLKHFKGVKKSLEKDLDKVLKRENRASKVIKSYTDHNHATKQRLLQMERVLEGKKKQLEDDKRWLTENWKLSHERIIEDIEKELAEADSKLASWGKELEEIRSTKQELIQKIKKVNQIIDRLEEIVGKKEVEPIEQVNTWDVVPEPSQKEDNDLYIN